MRRVTYRNCKTSAGLIRPGTGRPWIFWRLVFPSTLLLSGLVLADAVSVYADVGCRAEVSYQVKKTEGKEETELEFPFKGQEVRGPEETVVKQALEAKLSALKHEALELCRQRHENFSGCVGSKYAANGGLLQQMNFAARTKLQEAIESDCKSQQGKCVGAKVSEAVCAAVVSSAASSAEASSAPEKETGKKAGKK